MSAYRNVKYTKADGTPSHAYYQDPEHMAYDVYTRQNVYLKETYPDMFTEWQIPAEEPKPLEAPKEPRTAQPVKIVPIVSIWQIPLVCAFGATLIWLTWQFSSTGNF